MNNLVSFVREQSLLQGQSTLMPSQYNQDNFGPFNSYSEYFDTIQNNRIKNSSINPSNHHYLFTPEYMPEYELLQRLPVHEGINNIEGSVNNLMQLTEENDQNYYPFDNNYQQFYNNEIMNGMIAPGRQNIIDILKQNRNEQIDSCFNANDNQYDIIMRNSGYNNLQSSSNSKENRINYNINALKLEKKNRVFNFYYQEEMNIALSDSNYAQTSELIKLNRKENKLSQNDLVKLSEKVLKFRISQTTVCRLENGIISPSNIHKLGVKLMELFCKLNLKNINDILS